MRYLMLFSTLILITQLLSTSCEKVVDVDLNEANPRPVFEAYLENDSTCYVKASWTSSYYDQSSSPNITNAVMSISDNVGNSENLTYQGEGIYRGSNLIGVIGRTYTLSVDIDDDNYTATSTMQPLVPIDTFSTQSLGGFFGGGPNDRFWAYVNYTDPVSVTNYYAIRTTYYDSTDNKMVTDYSIADDELSNGISTRSFTTFRPFVSGEQISVEFASLDYSTFLYFKTLQDALGGAGVASAAPANPTTNFSEGALGYFGAWSKEIKPFTIP